MSQIVSTAYLMGGLGNQMFQIAHAVAQGLVNNIPSLFEPVSFTPMKQSKQTTNYVNNIFRNVNFTPKIENKKRISEKTWNDAQLSFGWDTSIEFYGYYQSSKNLLGCDEEIKDLFSPTEEFIKKIKLFYPDLNNKKTTSIHIRRGDYLTIGNVLPTLDVSYFNECINMLDSETNVFYVFSDDVNWVKENLKSDKIVVVDGFMDYEDLWMMSLCDNNIISNSSFSWWGSFLNRNKTKKVLCPDTWFGPNGIHPHDSIFESDWVKIPVEYNNGIFIKK